ncbi:Peptide deformylase 1B, chloroplastic [Turnera subulata]|uniref:Peptide deformylase n=1 Tax=Turnera subulata TaxID=218843 RepID=A0A9Q0JAX9_9ROSI|nr:Peptide deformylase 1B, chloroplastic [Turnera subulata]
MPHRTTWRTKSPLKLPADTKPIPNSLLTTKLNLALHISLFPTLFPASAEMAATLRSSSSLSRGLLLPFLHHQTASSASFFLFRRFHSTSRLTSTSIPPKLTRSLAVSAQAKRISPFKEAEVASPSDLQFESPLEIVKYPDPILRAKNKRIETFDENLKKLVAEMFDVMYKTDGIGLSAPQVGVNVQLMVFNPAGEPGEGEEVVLVNPRVSKSSKKRLVYNEGCLSFPTIYADVVVLAILNPRPESVKIDARDIDGATFSLNLDGLSARVFQHEFDHLQGILFFDRMTEEVLDGIRADLQALEKKYEDMTGLPSPERIKTFKGLRVATVVNQMFHGLYCPYGYPILKCNVLKYIWGFFSPNAVVLHTPESAIMVLLAGEC